MPVPVAKLYILSVAVICVPVLVELPALCRVVRCLGLYCSLSVCALGREVSNFTLAQGVGMVAAEVVVEAEVAKQGWGADKQQVYSSFFTVIVSVSVF